MLKRFAVLALAAAAVTTVAVAQPMPTEGAAPTSRPTSRPVPRGELAVRSGVIKEVSATSITVLPTSRARPEDDAARPAADDEAPTPQTFKVDASSEIRVAKAERGPLNANGRPTVRVTLEKTPIQDLKPDQHVSVRAEGDTATVITVQLSRDTLRSLSSTAPTSGPTTQP